MWICDSLARRSSNGVASIVNCVAVRFIIERKVLENDDDDFKMFKLFMLEIYKELIKTKVTFQCQTMKEEMHP